jgi:sortase A
VPRERRLARPARPRLGASVIGVLGELLLTAGVLVFLFLGWQLWFNDLVVGGQQQSEALELRQRWGPETGTPVEADPATFGDPVVPAVPADREQFANLYVPRFGADYVRPIAEGVGTRAVLNRIGVGHYPGTQMPGEVGNFAVAGHRTTHGAPFNRIAELRIGDLIIVETADGWYTYRFRTLDYVRPSGVEVLKPVPAVDGARPADRVITLTSCNPMFSDAERIIAYGVFDSWRPRSAGAPAEVSAALGGG